MLLLVACVTAHAASTSGSLRVATQDDLRLLTDQLEARAVIVGIGPTIEPQDSGIVLTRNTGQYRNLPHGSRDGWLAEIVNRGKRPIRVVLFTAIDAGPLSGIHDLRLRIDGHDAIGVWFAGSALLDACRIVERVRPRGCWSNAYDHVLYVMGEVAPQGRRTVDLSFRLSSQAVFEQLPRPVTGDRERPRPRN